MSDQGFDLGPAEPAVAAAQGRHRDRTNAERSNDAHKVSQALLDVVKPRALPPMAFGRKVDDVAGALQLARLPHMHAPDFEFAGLSGPRVVAEHRRIGPLELQRQPLAHDPDGVHGVDEGVDVSIEQVAALQGDHLHSVHVVRSTTGA